MLFPSRPILFGGVGPAPGIIPPPPDPPDEFGDLLLVPLDEGIPALVGEFPGLVFKFFIFF